MNSVRGKAFTCLQLLEVEGRVFVLATMEPCSLPLKVRSLMADPNPLDFSPLPTFSSSIFSMKQWRLALAFFLRVWGVVGVLGSQLRMWVRRRLYCLTVSLQRVQVYESWDKCSGGRRTDWASTPWLDGSG